MTQAPNELGILEETVRETNLVDLGLEALRMISTNAPSFEPERRRFLEYAASIAGLVTVRAAVTGTAFSGLSLLEGCAPIPEEFRDKTWSGWEAYLLRQDLLRGPSLWAHPNQGIPRDFQVHLITRPDLPGAVDYDVPIGTPVVPTAHANSGYKEYINGKALVLSHDQFLSLYLHLANYSEAVTKQKTEGYSMHTVVAFSGNTGTDTAGNRYEPHLHFSIRIDAPGLDPFKHGIDGGRPIYWDGVTPIDSYAKILEGKGDKRVPESRKDEVLAGLDGRLRGQDELDKTTVDELRKRGNDIHALRDYLGYKVLQKKNVNGKVGYEFMPGSLMYSLMLQAYNATSKKEFIAMLPFIFPPLKGRYQAKNPGQKL